MTSAPCWTSGFCWADLSPAAAAASGSSISMSSSPPSSSPSSSSSSPSESSRSISSLPSSDSLLPAGFDLPAGLPASSHLTLPFLDPITLPRQSLFLLPPTLPPLLSPSLSSSSSLRTALARLSPPARPHHTASSIQHLRAYSPIASTRRHRYARWLLTAHHRITDCPSVSLPPARRARNPTTIRALDTHSLSAPATRAQHPLQFCGIHLVGLTSLSQPSRASLHAIAS